MTTWAILATGPSLTPEQCEAVRHLRVVAVSDAYRLAPWADVLVSADAAWWRHHCPEFSGRRISARGELGTERMEGVPSGLNSGALAVRVARMARAERIILLGFDGRGSHFFGDHPEPLKNTSADRRKAHALQHRQEAFACQFHRIEVLNCTPGTVLDGYQRASLADALHDRLRFGMGSA